MDSRIRRSFTHDRSGSVAVGRRLALYEDDSDSEMPSISSFLKSFSGLAEAEPKDGKSAKLGPIFGVYLPSIQHILGVQMFLRLLWIVGIAGIAQSFAMVFLCCFCTFLTSISISAIATNGKVESGGTYFMLSRNLGAEFGGAIGVLYFLANAVATSMYLVGGVEILLIYMAPDLPRFGDSNSPHDEQMFNNFRLYGTAFLFVIFIFCCLGVRFVQFAAPVSMACVLLSILVVFTGAFVAREETSPRVCTLGKNLFDEAYLKQLNDSSCNKTALAPLYCLKKNSTQEDICDTYYVENEAISLAAIPGFNSKTFSENVKSNYMREGEAAPGHQSPAGAEVVQDMTTSFFVLMAIFFPSVTGIMTGANMSGDLRDPQKSIPLGTIAATLTTSLIYLSLVIVYGGSISGAVLRDKYGLSLGGKMLAAELAWPSEWILLVGSFTSCIGAGLQCLCSAPRLLQSIAKDDLIPILSPFRIVTKRNEPFRALLFTTVIAECAILIGGIDYIAPVVDLFFLLSYCFVNIACALQTLLHTPHWRPRFRFYHWSLAVLGALLNLFIMFSTYWYYALFALATCALLYKYIEYKGAKQEWGDGIRGLALSTAQYSLLRIEDTDKGTKHWRPQLLVYIYSEDVDQFENVKILHLASQLKAGRGLTMVTTFLKGEIACEEDRKNADALKEKIKKNLKDAKAKGFTEVVVSKNVPQNVDTLLQCVGMGCLRPNTFVLSWPECWKTSSEKQPQHTEEFMEILCRVTRARRCVIVPKGLITFPYVRDQLTGTIDVWWITDDSGLLVFLAHLLQQHKVWRACKMRIYILVHLEKNPEQLKSEVPKLITLLRISATVHVVWPTGCIEILRPADDASREWKIVSDPGEFSKQLYRTASTIYCEQPDDQDDIILRHIGASADGCDGLASSKDTENVNEERENPESHSSKTVEKSPSAKTNQGGLKTNWAPDHGHMQAKDARLLNERILEVSSNSRLVVLPLPKPPKMKCFWQEYLESIESLTDGMQRVLLLYGTGREEV